MAAVERRTLAAFPLCIVKSAADCKRAHFNSVIDRCSDLCGYTPMAPEHMETNALTAPSYYCGLGIALAKIPRIYRSSCTFRFGMREMRTLQMYIKKGTQQCTWITNALARMAPGSLHIARSPTSVLVPGACAARTCLCCAHVKWFQFYIQTQLRGPIFVVHALHTAQIWSLSLMRVVRAHASVARM